jgi:hypothetical protein
MAHPDRTPGWDPETGYQHGPVPGPNPKDWPTEGRFDGYLLLGPELSDTVNHPSDSDPLNSIVDATFNNFPPTGTTNVNHGNSI